MAARARALASREIPASADSQYPFARPGRGGRTVGDPGTDRPGNYACPASTARSSRGVTWMACLMTGPRRPWVYRWGRSAARLSWWHRFSCSFAAVRLALPGRRLVQLCNAAAAMPPALISSTVKRAASTTAATIPKSVAVLVEHTLKSLSVAKAIKAGALLAAMGCLATGGLVVVRGGIEPQKLRRPRQAGVPSANKAVTPAVAPSLADQFRRIVREFDDQRKLENQEAEKGKTPFERWKIHGEKSPGRGFLRAGWWTWRRPIPRILSAVGDALIWVIDKPYRSDNGSFGDEVQLAVNLLVQHHAEDPEVARLGLGLDNVVTRRRDAFLEGIYAKRRGQRGKGTGQDGARRVPGEKSP